MVIVGILILFALLGASAYSIVAPQFDSESWTPPVNPTQVGIGALAALAALFIVATIRLQKRLDYRGIPLRANIAGYIAAARVSALELEQADTFEKASEAITGADEWTRAVFELLGAHRIDFVGRLNGVAISDDIEKRSKEKCKFPKTENAWQFLTAHIGALDEMYRELAN